MSNKLIVCMLAGNTEKLIDMAIESVSGADKIIVIYDSTSKDKTGDKLYKWEDELGQEKIYVYQRIYEHENPKGNGRARNYYLNILKEQYPDDWCLVIDADEVVEDLDKIKNFIQTAEPALYSVKMRHVIGDLGHEDITDQGQGHWVPNRLFKVSQALNYPEVDHPVLTGSNGYKRTDCTTIWHLAYIPNLFDIKKRYDSHLKKSNMHTPEFLKQWYYWHLFGTYPKKPFSAKDLPSIILKNFGIDPDEVYFADRNIEFKHCLMVKQWHDYFKPTCVLDLGCGRGPYLYFWKWFIEGKQNVIGVELSDWACKHGFTKGLINGDVSDENSYKGTTGFDLGWDLITAVDILEHLDDEKLNKTLNNMAEYGNKFIFSIPFIGDPNLTNDHTHIQHKTKEEWIKLIESYGIKVKEPPADWLFKHQILIGENNE